MSNFLDKFSNILISNLMESLPVGGTLFLVQGQMDRRTDRYD